MSYKKVLDKYEDMLIQEGIVKSSTAKSPKKDYDYCYSEVQKLMTQLGAKVSNNKTQFTKDPQNWGYVASLRHIKAELENLLAYMD